MNNHIYKDMGRGRIYHGDCLEVMKEIPDGVVDMILCDLPYGTTANKWDAIIDPVAIMAHYWRVLKPSGVVVLTASQPFTTIMINAATNEFRYALVWDKSGTTGFQTAKQRPLRQHEDCLIFYRKQPTYNPQMEIRGKPRKKGGSKRDNGCYGNLRSKESCNNTYYPTSIISVSNAVKRGLLHPTQKPVELFEYLIRTYSNENNLILDNCAGSGTTAIASINTNRRWVCIEKDEQYFHTACERIQSHLEVK